MTKNKKIFLLPTLLAMLVLAASIFFAITTSAAAVTVLDSKVTVSDSANSISASGNSVTARFRDAVQRLVIPKTCG